MSGSRRRSLVDFLSSCVLAASDLLVLCTLVTSKRVFPGHETSVLTLCNFAPPSRRDDLETMHKAANAMDIDNFSAVLGEDNVQGAISRLEMWAENPVISGVLVAAYPAAEFGGVLRPWCSWMDPRSVTAFYTVL